MGQNMIRTRWAAIGAAIAVTMGSGAMWVANATGPAGGHPSVFVSITPCRLMDTRPSTPVGPRNTPIGTHATYSPAVHGTHGNCTIPDTAVAVSLNVTAVNATATGFITVFPADASRPNSSSVNFQGGQGATPNAVTTGLSAGGAISIYNENGTVNVIVDIVGYYEQTANPARVVWVAESGGDFTSLSAALASITDNDATHPYVVKIAPGTYTEVSAVNLKTYVDVQGSGRDITTIACACAGVAGSASTAAAAVIHGSTAQTIATVRDLTIANTGGGHTAVGVLVDSGISHLSFTNVDITATATDIAIGFNSPVNASPAFRNVEVTATSAGTSTGISLVGGNASLQDVVVTATATGTAIATGVYIGSATPTLDNVEATANADNATAFFSQSSAAQFSRIKAVANGVATAKGIYFDSSIDSVRGASMIVTCGAVACSSWGVLSDDSQLSLADVSINSSVDHTDAAAYGMQFTGGTLNVTGGTLSVASSAAATLPSVGILATSAVATIAGTSISVFTSASASGRGVRAESSSLDITDSQINVIDASSSGIGVEIFSSTLARITNSTVLAKTTSLTSSGSTIFVTGSTLKGSAVGATFTCTFNVDYTDATALDGLCA